MSSYVGLKVWDMGFDAHLTVCYFGKDLSIDDRYILETEIKPYQNLTYYAARKDLALFGPKNNIPVLTVHVPLELRHLQQILARFSVSEFTEWNPHVTLDLAHPGTIRIPQSMKMDRLGIY